MTLFSELQRRNVFRVAVAYTVIAWLLAQVSDVALDTFGTPEWVGKTTLFLLVLGFPLAVFFAWAFELTPEGIKKEKDVDRSQSITQRTGRKIDFLIIAVLVIGIGFLLVDKFGTPGEPDSSPTEVVATASPSIAVLPFDNRSSRQEDKYFTDGIHDDLLTKIANIGSMKVISRTSVMQDRSQERNLRDIAKELGVTAILEGGVQRSGEQVRINVQLIDAATDVHLWAEIYDRRLTAENLFSIQSEVSEAVAAALHATLSPAEAKRVEKVHTRNLEAYEAYMLGRDRWQKRTRESLDEAVKLFQQAIGLDPEYALAWAGLADAYLLQPFYSDVTFADVKGQAAAAVSEALRLDDQLGEANASLGFSHLMSGEMVEAEAALKRAIELAPNYATAYHWYASVLGSFGKHDESLDVFARALQLDPLSAVIRQIFANALTDFGRFDEALVQIERLLEIAPDDPQSLFAMSIYQMFVTGRLDIALKWLLRRYAQNPDSLYSTWIIVSLYSELGDHRASARWAKHANSIRYDEQQTLDFDLISALRQGNEIEVERLLQQVNNGRSEIHPDSILGRTLIEADIHSGDLAAAFALVRNFHPELFDQDPPDINASNYDAAPVVMRLLILSGDTAKALRMRDPAIKATNSAPLLGQGGSRFGNAAVYSVLGRNEEAIAEIRRGVDAGWRFYWRYHFDHYPLFAPLRDEPEFQRLRAEVAADMAKQLANVRTMQASGEMLSPLDGADSP